MNGHKFSNLNVDCSHTLKMLSVLEEVHHILLIQSGTIGSFDCSCCSQIFYVAKISSFPDVLHSWTNLIMDHNKIQSDFRMFNSHSSLRASEGNSDKGGGVPTVWEATVSNDGPPFMLWVE